MRGRRLRARGPDADRGPMSSCARPGADARRRRCSSMCARTCRRTSARGTCASSPSCRRRPRASSTACVARRATRRARDSPRVVVVTGGGKGIGSAVVERFAAHGDWVVAVGPRPRASRRPRLRARAEVCDVTEELPWPRWSIGSVPSTCSSTTPASHHGALERTTLADWRAQLDVNATGAFLCTRAVVGGMIERGRADRHGRVDRRSRRLPLHRGYTASKHAAVGLMRAVAAEVAGTGVTANAVCPTYVRTDMTHRSVQRIVAATGPHRGGGRGGADRLLSARSPAGTGGGRLRGRLPCCAEAGGDQRSDARPRRRRIQ